MAARLQVEIAQAIEKDEVKQSGKSGPTAAVLLAASRYQLFEVALSSSARDFYRKYTGQRTMEGCSLWEEEILNDFNELKKAGLKHPLMDEIRDEFASARKAQ